MRCMLIKASTDKSCRNLFFDLCIEKRYPELTFGRTAEEFECPGLLQLLRPRAEIRERRRYRLRRSSAQRRQRRRRMRRSSTRAGARPRRSRFLASRSAVRSCTATKRASCPSCNPRPPLLLLPPPHCPRHITASPIPEPAQKQQQLQERQHMFIGKLRKT
ncbi:hypothetical protein EDB84DRAFT_970740 [Lactarius hengduanensis]|nr:hypothetical protein EDB84DRAFT_970740 [Lactarius hengduanensis]